MGIRWVRPALHLTAGLGLLLPEEQAPSAMLDGWGAQQAVPRLSPGAVAARRRAVSAFAAHAEAFPVVMDGATGR